ncbi:hypothetical protein Mycch_4765 [Mycolicibacterium chubuense NBB4]|uniref:Helix-turn-helix DNA binding domain protein n=1 Tax=Mycolicibacterium chubuense (strain NBB4) TaxID=710421 RepID=I4BQA6_MYCCN|nr:hypothetical protein [Mycolicibacterium chubuense]AFM19463.1 hypothetical protein Mycch_4765 [Mycolicibacterium chubuense NBB4]
MKRPDFLQPLTADIGRVGDRGANILALVRYVTAHTEEIDGRKWLDDGEMWWRATREDIGDALGGVSEKSVGGALRKLEDAGELLARPAKSFHGDRAKMYRVPNMPQQGSDVPSDENGTGSDLPSDENAPPIGRNRPTPWDENVRPPGTKSSDLPPIEELEEGEKARAAEPEPLDVKPVPDPDNAHPSQTVNGNSDSNATSPPSPYCARHPNGTTTNCAPCGVARKQREAWDQELAAVIDAERAAIRAEISACPDCDQNGLTEPEEGPTRRCTQHRQLADLPAVRRAS